MDAVWKLLLAGWLIWWLSQMLEVSTAKFFESSQYIHKLKPDTRFVVGFGRKNFEIFCLGAIISPQAIMTLASCFDEAKADDGMESYNNDYHERRRRKIGSRQKKKTRSGDRESDGDESEISSSKFDPTFYAQDGDADAEEEEDDVDDDEEPQVVQQEPFSLFRIDPVRRVFVRLTAQVSRTIPHHYYNKLKGAYLWAYNVGVAFTDIPLDFEKKKTIRPIRIYFDGFGKYVKSLNEAMMNADYCHVIGLVEYNDYGSYTPKDTDVELISRHVLMDYDDCTNQYCRLAVENANESCAGTGYHLSKNPADPLPFMVNGSPLVCRGRLMSIVNMKSECNVTKFSGEFPSPRTVRRFISILSTNQSITLVQYDQNTTGLIKPKPNSTFPSIPFPKWRINAGLLQPSYDVCFSALVLVTTIISL